MHPTVMGMIAIERANRLEQVAHAKRRSNKTSRRARKLWLSPRAARIAHA